MSDVAERFVRAFAAKDAGTLRAVLSEDVDFRALTPNQFWESRSSTEVVDEILLGQWLEPTDHIEDVVSIESSEVADRHRVGYRLQGRNPDGPFTMEQQAYFDLQGDRICWLRIMCSGFRPSGPRP